MPTPYCVIDVFMAEALRGNPAAVCWMESLRDAGWMQSVAAEMNLSETAFVEPRADGFGLRWFTPTIEVPLYGHATLATAHMLYATGRLERSQAARFHIRSGLLTARAGGNQIAIVLPVFSSIDATPPAAPIAAVGVHPTETRRIDRDGTDPIWIFGLEDEAPVRETALQASRRSGVVEVDVLGQRVELRGDAVTVCEGKLLA